jgi:uncharacterized membrane protein
MLSVFGSKHAELWLIKLLLLLLDFFIAFFSFTSAIRMFNHVGYMISIPAGSDSTIKVPQVASHLNRAGRYYSLGMSAYYISVPLVFWLFGPVFLVLATIGLVIVLYYLDRTPAEFYRS